MFRPGQYFRAVVKGEAQLPETGISVKRVATNTFESNADTLKKEKKVSKKSAKAEKSGKKTKKGKKKKSKK